MDERIAGIVMFLPCIDGVYDRKVWGEGLWAKVQRNRQQQGALVAADTIQFWPLSDAEAAGSGGSVLSGDYVREWSVVAQKIAEQGGDDRFSGSVTLRGFWNDFHCRPIDFLDRVGAGGDGHG